MTTAPPSPAPAGPTHLAGRASRSSPPACPSSASSAAGPSRRPAAGRGLRPRHRVGQRPRCHDDAVPLGHAGRPARRGGRWLVAAATLPRLRRTARGLTAVGGLSTIGVVLAPMASRSESDAVHVAFATLAIVALSVWPPWSGRAGEPLPVPQRRPVAIAATAVLLPAHGLRSASSWLADAGTFGLCERIAARPQALWPLVVGLGAWWAAGPPGHAARPAPRALRRPRPGRGPRRYGRDDRLADDGGDPQLPSGGVALPGPARTRAGCAPTVFGDVSVGFRGFAPGMVVRPQVRRTITDVLAEGTTDFRPRADPGGGRRGGRAAVLGDGDPLRRRGGGRCPAARRPRGRARAAPVAARRAGHPPAPRLAAVLAAALTASVGTGLAARATYQPEPHRGIRLDRAHRLPRSENQGNLLRRRVPRPAGEPLHPQPARPVLGAEEEVRPGGRARPSSCGSCSSRDVHDANVYAMARTIITEERINAVIDTGDIVDFGRVEELDAAGIPAGIASLGVPYLFVRGNHDAVSADDQAILRRLDKVPNVVLLQPGRDTYRRPPSGGCASPASTTRAGTATPAVSTGRAQEPARAAFLASFADRPPLDVVASHEPEPSAACPGRVLVNGHMHTPALDGNRIQAGTFSGGGPFSHYLQRAPGEELTGQPSAFDILDFGTDCRLVSLTPLQLPQRRRGQAGPRRRLPPERRLGRGRRRRGGATAVRGDRQRHAHLGAARDPGRPAGAAHDDRHRDLADDTRHAERRPSPWTSLTEPPGTTTTLSRAAPGTGRRATRLRHR